MGSAPVFLAGTSQLDAASIRLDGVEGRHASLVRRLRRGERLVVTDGAGRVAECRVELVDRSGLTCTVQRRYDEPRPQPRLVVVQALPKGDRALLAVEGLTEVGVDVIVPWAAQRCVTQWRGDRVTRGVQRWRTSAREAAKQSRRAWLPDVRELAATEDVCALLAGAACAVVLHESARRSLTDVEVPARGDVVVVVGPEGGLTDDELSAFVDRGAEAFQAGPTVLRTSTAGTVAAAVLLSRTQRWWVSAP